MKGSAPCSYVVAVVRAKDEVTAFRDLLMAGRSRGERAEEVNKTQRARNERLKFMDKNARPAPSTTSAVT